MRETIEGKFRFFFVPLSLSATGRLLRLLMPLPLVLFLAALTARFAFNAADAKLYEAAATTGWLWLHLATVVPSIPLAIYLLANPKGTPHHRLLGKIWCGLMVTTALAALMIRGYFLPNWHGFNFIHLFSVITLTSVPRIILAARRHDVAGHQGAVYGLCLGGLFIAGLFTFIPGRLLGTWLFGL
jgi:uncharacterized membrane protein